MMKSKKRSENTSRQMAMKHNLTKCMRCSKCSSKREAHNNTFLPQETRNISNKQPNLTPKAITERRTKKTPKFAEGKKS